MGQRTCSVDGCEMEVKARGWCSIHYARWRNHGHTDSLTPTRGLSLGERFWMLVDKRSADECWEWTGQRVPTGYGYLRYGRQMMRAHRVSWQLAHERPVPQGMAILHRCDNPMCVNPAHLNLGTQLENIADRNRKERQARGEGHADAKLTELDVHDIRRRAPHERHRALADEFGVSHATITSVATRRTWRHIP